jgi:hypothetical protein
VPTDEENRASPYQPGQHTDGNNGLVGFVGENILLQYCDPLLLS